MDPNEPAGRIGLMHGQFRVPILLKRVDRLSRNWIRFGCAAGGTKDVQIVQVV
jgi:hypothetical protein